MSRSSAKLVGKALRLLLGERHPFRGGNSEKRQAQCILVIIGATSEGRKELVGFTDGIREKLSQSWRDLLLDVRRRGLTTGPQIAVADGALGFWKGQLGEVWPNSPRATLLGAQDRGEHPEQAAKEPAHQGQARRCRRSEWQEQEECVCGIGSLCRNLPSQIRQGGRMPDQGYATRCWRSTISPPSTGSTCERPTPLKAPLRPSGTAPSDQKAACRNKTAWPWSSSLSRAPEELAPHRRPQPVAELILGVKFADEARSSALLLRLKPPP